MIEVSHFYFFFSQNSALCRQLRECRDICSGLSKKMDDLTDFADDLQVVDGQKVIEFKGMMVEARNVLTYLMMMLDGKIYILF